MLPERLRGEKFYVPSDNGYEKKIREHMSRITGDPVYTEPEELISREPAE